MTLLESESVQLGSDASDFSLTGIDDKKHTLADFSDADVLVIVFMCNHCPYVQAIWNSLVKLQERFGDGGVRFVGINPNFNPDYPEDSLEKMKEYFDEYNMNFPYLIDESQEVARAYGAVCTPDIFVYDKDRKLRYHGRIDDDLANAILALTKGETPSIDQHPSMGCSIKWRN